METEDKYPDLLDVKRYPMPPDISVTGRCSSGQLSFRLGEGHGDSQEYKITLRNGNFEQVGLRDLPDGVELTIVGNFEWMEFLQFCAFLIEDRVAGRP